MDASAVRAVLVIEARRPARIGHRSPPVAMSRASSIRAMDHTPPAIPATLGSAAASARRTGQPCGPLATQPTGVCVTPKRRPHDRLPTWSRSLT